MTTSRPATAPAWPPADPVAADGRRIALHRPAGGGEGPAGDVPILLLHGLHETSEAWSQVAAGLPQGQRILAPDLPGLGASEARGAYAISDVVATLAALVLEEIDGPVDVVGRGWGAALAIALAAARPELIRRLVAVSGPWPPSLAAGPGNPAPGITRRLRLMARPGGSQTARIRRQYLSDIAVSGAPHPERSLVIWGAHDRLLPPRYGEKIVTNLGRFVDPATVGMITYPGLGAALPHTAPALLASSLCEFLRAS